MGIGNLGFGKMDSAHWDSAIWKVTECHAKTSHRPIQCCDPAKVTYVLNLRIWGYISHSYLSVSDFGKTYSLCTLMFHGIQVVL